MEEHIFKINSAVEVMRRRTPKHPAFAALHQYRSQYKMDYYMALDSVGQKLGIKGVAHPAFDELTGLHEGWVGCVQYEEGNPLDLQQGEVGLKHFPEYGDCYTECCVYAAKKQLRELMKVQDLASLILY